MENERKICELFGEKISFNIKRTLECLLSSNDNKNDSEKRLEFLKEAKRYLETEIYSIEIDKINHKIDKINKEIKEKEDSLIETMNIMSDIYGRISIPADNIKIAKNDIEQDIENKNFEDKIKIILTTDEEVRKIIFNIVENYLEKLCTFETREK